LLPAEIGPKEGRLDIVEVHGVQENRIHLRAIQAELRSRSEKKVE
jgi:hypothetical protein